MAWVPVVVEGEWPHPGRTVALLRLTSQPPTSKAPDAAGSSRFLLGGFRFYDYL